MTDIPIQIHPIQIHPIGVVQDGRLEPFDDDWAEVEARIVVDDRFPPDSTAGLEEFSHLDVVYLFHLVDADSVHVGARHPRGRRDWPSVGIFAQRAKARPNRIGVTTCELLDVDGRRPHSAGARRHSRHTGARSEALHDRLCAEARGARTRMGPRAHGQLLDGVTARRRQCGSSPPGGQMRTRPRSWGGNADGHAAQQPVLGRT